MASIEAQTYKHFELIIVDDGSTDGTMHYLTNFVTNTQISCLVHYQTNSGKPAARNWALDKARGELFLTVDSDGILDAKALEVFAGWWQHAATMGRPNLLGIEACYGDLATGIRMGPTISNEPLITNHISAQHQYGLNRDRIRVVRTDIFKGFKFPIIPGEKFITESTVWNRFAYAGYEFCYVNDIVALNQYLSDGLTSQGWRLRVKNPAGAALYYREFVDCAPSLIHIPLPIMIRNLSNFVRYSLHMGTGFGAITSAWKLAPTQSAFWLSAPIGAISWLIDRLRIKK